MSKIQKTIDLLEEKRAEIEDRIGEMREALSYMNPTLKQRAEYSWLAMIESCLRREDLNPYNLSLEDTIRDLKEKLEGYHG